MSRFSVVVPLLGKPALFEDTLASVLRYRCPASQIIVAHADAYEDPYGLGKEVDFVEVKSQSPTSAVSLIQLFNAASRVARGEIVAMIRPGVQLNENWDGLVAAAFADPNVGCVAPAVVSSKMTNRLVVAGVTASSSFNRRLVGSNQRLGARQVTGLKPLGPTSWAAFYRRTLLSALGEFDEQLDPLYLDLDLALSLQTLNFGCKFHPDCVVTVTDADAIETESTLAHGRSAQRAVVRYADYSRSYQRMKLWQAVLAELAVSPWRHNNLLHAWQRLSATKFQSVDEHHRSLLAVLKKQRPRLIGLQSKHDEAPVSLVRPGNLRQPAKRAA